MIITIIHDLITRPVPRKTKAPWLKERATKVITVYPFVFRVQDPTTQIDDTIVIPAGYVLDWSSIPRPLWLFYPPNYSEARRGAAAHDYLYSHLYWHYPKAFADRLLVAFMKKEGSNRFTQLSFFVAVRTIGGGGWRRQGNPKFHPHWSQYHERHAFSDDCQISTSPFAAHEDVRPSLGGGGGR